MADDERPSTKPDKVILVFADDIGDETALRFIEAQDGSGRTIEAGEWRQLADGRWELEIDPALFGP